MKVYVKNSHAKYFNRSPTLKSFFGEDIIRFDNSHDLIMRRYKKEDGEEVMLYGNYGLFQMFKDQDINNLFYHVGDIEL